jgi:hypothetical protein
MALVTSTPTALRQISGITQMDVTHVCGTTTTSRTLLIADNATTADVQAQVSADAQTWYTSDIWYDQLAALVDVPIDQTL